VKIQKKERSKSLGRKGEKKKDGKKKDIQKEIKWLQ